MSEYPAFLQFFGIDSHFSSGILVIIIVWAIFYYRERILLKRVGVHADGKIIGIKREAEGYAAIIEYVVVGETYTSELSISFGKHDKWIVGEVIDIMYHPSNPNRVIAL